MDRKFLEGLGIDKENNEKIMAQHGVDITGYQTQISTKDATIKALRDDVITKDGRIAELEKVDAEKLEADLASERAGREKDRREFALRSVLQKEGCQDVDYMLFKLGDSPEFDENGNLKNEESFIKSLKENYANQFAEPGIIGTGSIGNFQRNRGEKTVTLEDYKKMSYSEKLELKTKQPEVYKTIKAEMKGE